MESGGEQDWWVFLNPSAAGVVNSVAGAEGELCPATLHHLGIFWYHQHQRCQIEARLTCSFEPLHLFEAIIGACYLTWICTFPHLFVLPQQDFGARGRQAVGGFGLI